MALKRPTCYTAIMSRSFLVRFRHADARSLARALILLFLLNGVLGAFHSGIMAGAGPNGAVLCTGAGISVDGIDRQSVPTTEDHRLCCIVGCTNAQPGTVAMAEGRLRVEPKARLDDPKHGATVIVPLRRPDNAGPRGPPVLT